MPNRKARVWRVGFLTQRRRPDSIDADFIGAFPRGMRELGYVEGKNLVIEWRFADGKSERLPDLAAELVRLKVDVIVTGSSQAISAAQKATTTIPIVMATTGDPVGSGFVKSLARPGGNITGLSNLSSDIGTKHLELLLGMVPKLSRVAVLVNPANPAHRARSEERPVRSAERQRKGPAGGSTHCAGDRERISRDDPRQTPRRSSWRLTRFHPATTARSRNWRRRIGCPRYRRFGNMQRPAA